MAGSAAIRAGKDGGPTFLFGLGAARSGTSRLYRYLAAHPDCHLRSVPELHFFGDENPGRVPFQIRQLRKRKLELEGSLATIAPRARDERRRVGRQIRDIDALLDVHASGDRKTYLSYLTAGRAGRPVVADITPAYALLPVGTLREMAEIAPDVRFVYLMRDPVARLWSHVRMLAGRAIGQGKMPDHGAAVAAEIFRRVIAGDQEDVTRRGDYRDALTRFDAGLPAARLHLEFFEDVFSAAGLARLCDFIGITPVEDSGTNRVWSRVTVAMTRDQRERALAVLRPQYEYVAARMGRLPRDWAASMSGEA